MSKFELYVLIVSVLGGLPLAWYASVDSGRPWTDRVVTITGTVSRIHGPRMVLQGWGTATEPGYMVVTTPSDTYAVPFRNGLPVGSTVAITYRRCSPFIPIRWIDKKAYYRFHSIELVEHTVL